MQDKTAQAQQAKQAQNQKECSDWCTAGGDGSTTDVGACTSKCVADKNAQQAASASNITDAAKKMDDANCPYCNAQHEKHSPPGCQLNGCSGNPPFTDCSNFISTAYQQAGCQSPGNTTADMYPKGQAVSDFSSLKAGDIIVIRKSSSGHAVMCEADGCAKVIHASGQKDGIRESESSYYQGQNAHVLSASDYCPTT
jgi:cell wall-associated NlpC family hydrolase